MILHKISVHFQHPRVSVNERLKFATFLLPKIVPGVKKRDV